MDLSTACDDMMRSPVPGIAFEVEISDSNVSSPSIPKRVRRRLLETCEHRSRSPASLQEIEAKLKEAESRRQQFHEWLANKAKPKMKTPLCSPQPENLGQRLKTKLIAAEQKRLDLLAQEQTRLARSHELRAAARIEVQLRAEKEREELESKVESRVQQAETNRLALLEAEKLKRAAAHERLTQSVMQRMTQEDKDRERVEALRALICQKIAAAEEKRANLLKAERTRAQALVLQARRVAKAVSRKRELESRHKKELLEARLQRAKKKRADYLEQRGGCQGVCHSDRHKMRRHGERLCQKLTRCWRRFQHSRHTTLKLTHDFAACSINKQAVISLPFEEVAARITSPTTLRSVKALLARLESRFLLSSASRSNIAKIDHLIKRLSPPNKKSGVGIRTGRRTHAQESSKTCSQNVTKGPSKEALNSTGMRNGNGSQNKEEKGLDRYPARVFLCAYMILGHPEAVFSVQGEREVALSKAALKLVPEFEALVSTIVDGPPSTFHTRPSSPSVTAETKTNLDVENSLARSFAVQLAEFDAAWCSYLYQFVAWKVQDAHLLEDDLIRVACQLELSMLQKCNLASADDAGAEASLDSQAIQKQVLEDHQLLKERILHLTGAEGVTRMEEALSQARTQVFEARERGSLPSSPFASPQKPLLYPPASHLTSSKSFKHESKEGASGGSWGKSLLPSFNQVREMKTSPMEHFASSFQLVPNMTDDEKGTDNEKLVNEMLHDLNWSAPGVFSGVNKSPGKLADIQAQIKTTIEDAFWNMVMEGLAKDPPNYERITGLLKEMKTELENLAPESWKQEINECLDVQIFSQVLQSGSHDYAYFQKLLDYALGIVLKLGAPARDSDVTESLELLLKELSQFSSRMEEKSQSSFGVTLVKGLRFVLEQIQILKADISAARIKALAPIIQGSAGVEYLQKSFVKRYKLPEASSNHPMDSFEKLQLPKTVEWLAVVRRTLELEKEELEALRAAYWATGSEKGTSRGLVPPMSSMRTGARAVVGKPIPIATNSAASSPGLEQSTLLWTSMQTFIGLGIVHLVCEVQALTEDTIAETLRLNVHRLRKAQNDYQRLILMATGLLLLRQNAIERGISGDELESLLGNCKEELDTLINDPGVTIPQIGFLLAKFSAYGGDGSGANVVTDADLMSRVLNRSLSPDDTVLKHVSAAVQTGLRAIILLGKGAEGLALVNLTLQRIGANCLRELIVDLGNSLERLTSVSCSVHEPWYACMLTSN